MLNFHRDLDYYLVMAKVLGLNDTQVVCGFVQGTLESNEDAQVYAYPCMGKTKSKMKLIFYAI